MMKTMKQTGRIHVTEGIGHGYFDEIRARCSNAAEKVRLIVVRRMKRKAKKTNKERMQAIPDTVDSSLAFELDGDFRCGGDTWISDR